MPETNYTQLKENISSGNFFNIYLLQGEEYIVEYFEKSLKNNILNKNFNDFDMTVFHNDNLNIDNLSLAIETLPIQSSRKCIIIHNLPLESWNNEKLDNFLNIISDIPDYICLIITQYEEIKGIKNITKFKKIQKEITSKGCFSSFSKKDIPVEKQLMFWAHKDFGKILSLEYAKKIQKMCPIHTLKALKNELKKICEFETSDTITQKSLEVLISSNDKISVFDLPKAIYAKNLKKSIEILNLLLNQGEEPISLLAVISSEYIDIYRVKICSNEKIAVSTLSQIYDYKNKEFRLKNAEKKSTYLNIYKIKQYLKYLLKADIKLKTTSLKPKLILSQLIAELTA